MELTVEFAAPSDDAGIRALMQRQTMPGRISLAFAREPDFSRGCAVTGEDFKIVVARARDEIVGVACRSVRNVFLNGRETRLGYLGQLRVDDRFRGDGSSLAASRSSAKSIGAIRYRLIWLRSSIAMTRRAACLFEGGVRRFRIFAKSRGIARSPFGQARVPVPHRTVKLWRDPSSRFRKSFDFCERRDPVASFFRCGPRRICEISTA